MLKKEKEEAKRMEKMLKRPAAAAMLEDADHEVTESPVKRGKTAKTAKPEEITTPKKK